MNRPVITAWSAVSPYGIGHGPFARGLANGAAPSTELPASDGDLPQRQAFLVPDFEIKDVLGRKGTRSMDRVSALAVTTVRELLDSAERNRLVATGDNAALVLGTTTGSAQSMMDITRDTLIHEKPFYLDAARIPNAIMNSAAAQCAIWHGLKGPNATIAGGRVAALFALRYAWRLLESQRAQAVLFGGAEEYSPSRAWLEYHGLGGEPGEPDEPGEPLGEGCALLLLEPGAADPGASAAAGEPQQAAPALAEVLAVELGVYTEGTLTETLTACLRRALSRAEVTADEVWAVSSVPAAGARGEAESAALAGVFGSQQTERLPGFGPWGDAGAVTAAFQIAGVLAAAQRDPRSRGRVVAVTSVDRDMVLGCALLRMGES